jgi:UDP-3-O-[3-hydroxymyristoyl] glucosamine N-acyltransferase
LSDYFQHGEVLRDGSFIEPGNADSESAGTLAYCDTVFYVDVATENPNVTCIITTSALAQRVVEKGLVVAASPRTAFYRLHQRLLAQADAETTRIHGSAIVSAGAKVGRGVTIGERVIVRDGVEIGDESFVDAGAILGAEGLLYYQDSGRNRRVHHRGGVRIGKQVCILANAVVVRGIHPSMPTVIEHHATVGIASTIGHECWLGANAVVSGNCVIARRAHIGAGAWIGTSSVVREYVRVGAGASVKAGSVVVEDVPEGAEVSGNFAIAHRRRLMQFLRDKK